MKSPAPSSAGLHLSLDTSRTGITVAVFSHLARTTALPTLCTTSHMLAFFSLYAGSMHVCLENQAGTAASMSFSPGNYCIACPPGVYAVSLQSEVPCMLMGLSLSQETLAAILGADFPSPELFAPSFGAGGACIHWEDAVPNAQIRLAGSQLLGCAMTGKSRQLYVDSKSIEMLSIYVNLLQGRALKPNGLSNEDIQKLHMARSVLVKRMDNPPSIVELSRICGINEFKLKWGFKKIFRQTIFDAVRKERMAYAKHLIEEKEYSVSNAAYEVGYSNVSKFISTFKAEYGKTPGAFLSKMKTD